MHALKKFRMEQKGRDSRRVGFSIRCGVSHVTLANIEEGRGKPSLQFVCNLSTAFGLSLERARALALDEKPRR